MVGAFLPDKQASRPWMRIQQPGLEGIFRDVP
jgi:hypothetical protein